MTDQITATEQTDPWAFHPWHADRSIQQWMPTPFPPVGAGYDAPGPEGTLSSTAVPAPSPRHTEPPRPQEDAADPRSAFTAASTSVSQAYGAEAAVNLRTLRANATAPAVSPAVQVDDVRLDAGVFAYRPAQPAARSRVEPAQWGWRGRVRRATFGALHPKPSRDELLHRRALDAIRGTFPAARTIAVVQPKGGASKTPTTLLLSAFFSSLRSESCVAWDNNELHGTLAYRAEVSEPKKTVIDLLGNAEWLARADAQVGDLAAFLRRQPEGNLVLASSNSPTEMQQIDEGRCEWVRELLLRRWATLFMDTGNNRGAPNWLYTVDHADVLVIPCAPTEDHMKVLATLLHFLALRHSTAHLVASATVVITSDTGARLSAEDAAWLSPLVGCVLEVPPDPEIARGADIRSSELTEASRRAWTLVAAAVAEAAARPSIHDYHPPVPAGRTA